MFFPRTTGDRLTATHCRYGYPAISADEMKYACSQPTFGGQVRVRPMLLDTSLAMKPYWIFERPSEFQN